MASWLFDDGKGDDVVGFVGEAQVGVQPTLAHMLGQGRGKLEQGLAQGVVPHAHRVERGRRGDAGAECLAEGLLGREALGQQPGRVGRGGKGGALGGVEDALSKARATRTMSVPTPWITAAGRVRRPRASGASFRARPRAGQ